MYQLWISKLGNILIGLYPNQRVGDELNWTNEEYISNNPHCNKSCKRDELRFDQRKKQLRDLLLGMHDLWRYLEHNNGSHILQSGLLEEIHSYVKDVYINPVEIKLTKDLDKNIRCLTESLRTMQVAIWSICCERTEYSIGPEFHKILVDVQIVIYGLEALICCSVENGVDHYWEVLNMV